jgi:hypothetical protein
VVKPRTVIDPLDLAQAPLFVTTMLAEHAVLRRRATRALPPLSASGADDGPDRDVPDDGLRRDLATPHELPPDPLVPLGYERADTAGSLGTLAGSVVVGLLVAGGLGRLERLVFRRRISNLGQRRGAFAMAMVLWDFLYYWDHRWMHEVRLLWAHHVSHHSSRRYNLSTALRQPWSPFLTAWVFLPMPLLGFKSSTIRRAGQLNLLYQYWIHTEAIDRLPAAAEAVLNTPSHHRVHHGVNPQYLDKNYGGILIVWDKLFGTFEPEVRRVRYGLTKNITTHNPLGIAYHEMTAIARDVVRAKGLRNRLGYVFRRPGWSPADAA